MKKELISMADLEDRKQANTVKLQTRGGRCLSRRYLGRKGCTAISSNMIPTMSAKMRAGDRKGCLQVLWQSYSSKIQHMDRRDYLYMETRKRHVWNIRNKNTKFNSHKIKDTLSSLHVG